MTNEKVNVKKKLKEYTNGGYKPTPAGQDLGDTPLGKVAGETVKKIKALKNKLF